MAKVKVETVKVETVKVETRAHLSLIRGRGKWHWGCSDCGVIFCSTPVGERPKAVIEECPCCGVKIDRTEGKPDAK